MALTNRDAAIVLGMVARGDKRHDIAAWFGENQARIAEIEQGSHGSIAAAPAAELPPKGAPGPKGRRLRAFVRPNHNLRPFLASVGKAVSKPTAFRSVHCLLSKRTKRNQSRSTLSDQRALLPLELVQ